MHQRQWNVNKIEYFNFYCDDRGDLLPIDFKELPFVPQRIFVVNHVKDCQIRGQHAHKKCKQIILCLTGEVWIVTYDGKKYVTKEIFPGQALYIPPVVWCNQVFYNSGSIMVFASDSYDEKDYIRNFEEFLEIAK